MTEDRYQAHGPEAEFEPGSRGRVLANKLGIRRVRDMQQAESDALLAVQEWAVAHFSAQHRFAAEDICLLHRQWLGAIYPWAGKYRRVNVSKGGFLFAPARQIGRLMTEYETNILAPSTPCAGMDEERLITSLARAHGELVIIHPFREGNGRCARLLSWLMALQAGLPALDFAPMAGRGKCAYIAAIQQAVAENHGPLEACFRKVIRRTSRVYQGQG
jgi:cell filamentation protein